MQAGRIQFLDGLRAIAVLVVVAHHYLARWTYPLAAQNLYPYGDLLAQFPIAKFGYLGVQLFFVISGFVIALTLYKSASFYEFAVRRFARLWPAMLLCATLSYALLQIIPHSPFTPAVLDFIPSLTFIDPDVFNHAIHSHRFHWMDSAYWSLFWEVRFYVLIGALHFVDRERFSRNVIIASAIVSIAYGVALLVGVNLLAAVINGVFIAQHLPWFLMGIGFYFRQVGKSFVAYFAVAGVGLAAQAAVASGSQATVLLASGIGIPVFVWAATRVSVLNRLLSLSWLTRIGAASYSLYLLHQNIGVALIHSTASGTHGWTVVFSVVVFALIAAMALLIYRYWEVPWNRRIVSALAERARTGGGAIRTPV